MLKTKRSRSITYWLVILALYVVSAAVHAHGYDNFFAEFARTVRKYGGSLVTCVQNFSDLQKTDQHRAILENSTAAS